MRVLRLLGLSGVLLWYIVRTAWAARRVPVPERPRVRAAFQQQGARACLRTLGVRLRAVGAPPETPTLVTPNHLGLLDGFVLAAALPVALAGREDVQRWPLIGWVARTMGYLPVDRSRRASADAFAAAVQERLASGVSVLVFPEGTTTKGDRLLPFKTGAFEAVAGTAYPVLPVYHVPVETRGRPVTPEALEDITWATPAPSVPVALWRALAHAPLTVEVRLGAPLSAATGTRKTLAQDARDAVRALAGRNLPAEPS